VRSREWLRALDSNREGLDTLLKAMSARVREGYAAEADLAKFQAESARVQTQQLRARLELARSLAQLGSLMQEPIPLRAEQLAEPLLGAPPTGDPAALAAQARRSRRRCWPPRRGRRAPRRRFRWSAHGATRI
jgi:outer membrane protein TolC